jgi:sugar phosphate isomerase/epimerase
METIDLAASAGFTGVDLLIRDLVDTGTDLRDLKSRMTKRGLRAGAWPLPVDWRDDDHRFTRDLNNLPALAAAAAELGFSRAGTRVMTETRARPPDPAAEIDRTFELHVRRLTQIARVLKDHGHQLGLEVVGVESFAAGHGWPFLRCLTDLVPLLAAIDSNVGGVVGVLADAFHLYASDETYKTATIWGANRVVWAHVADLPPGATGERHLIQDSARGLPGEHGAVDCRAFLKHLAAAGYSGPVTAEPLSQCQSLRDKSPLEVALSTFTALERVWPPHVAVQDVADTSSASGAL